MSQNINVYFLFFHFDIKSFSRYKISFLYKIVTDVFDVKKVKKNEQSYNTNMICFVYFLKKKEIKSKTKSHDIYQSYDI